MVSIRNPIRNPIRNQMESIRHVRQQRNTKSSISAVQSIDPSTSFLSEPPASKAPLPTSGYEGSLRYGCAELPAAKSIRSLSLKITPSSRNKLTTSDYYPWKSHRKDSVRITAQTADYCNRKTKWACANEIWLPAIQRYNTTITSKY